MNLTLRQHQNDTITSEIHVLELGLRRTVEVIASSGIVEIHVAYFDKETLL